MIGRGLTRYRDVGLVLLRAGIGIAFILHGAPKLMGGPERWQALGSVMAKFGIGFWPTGWGFVAGLAETVGGALVVLGLLFRPACLVLLIQMLVALFAAHLWSDVPARRAFSSWSHAFEAAVLFASLLLIGPGKYSLDRE